MKHYEISFCYASSLEVRPRPVRLDNPVQAYGPMHAEELGREILARQLRDKAEELHTDVIVALEGGDSVCVYRDERAAEDGIPIAVFAGFRADEIYA